MLGLVKMLGSLLVIVKNIPNLFIIIPKLVLPYTASGDSEYMKDSLTSDDRLSPPQVLSATVEIAKILVQPEYLKAKVRIETKKIEDLAYELQRHLDELERIHNDPEIATEEERDLLTEIENQFHEDFNDRISEDAETNLSGLEDTLVIQKAKEIDPPIRTAVAPVAVMFGIPTGIQWLVTVLSGLGGVSVTTKQQADSEFNTAANKVASDECFAIGRTGDASNILKICSEEERPTFSYTAEGGVKSSVNLKVDDDLISTSPEYTIEIQSIGIEIPPYQQRQLEYGVDNTGNIVLLWNITEPSFIYKFDSYITFKVEGTKNVDGESVRASNTFTVAVEFASTYPQQ